MGFPPIVYEKRKEPDEELPPDHDALDYLRAVYQGKIVADHARMRAATVAVSFEEAKLSVSARISHRGMGDALEARHRQRFAPQSAKVIEAERQR